MILETIEEFVNGLAVKSIPNAREEVLLQLVNYIQDAKDKDKPINLNFICTHNSRRSQFSQVWGQFMANHYGVPNVKSGSGGVEVTTCNTRTIDSLKRTGFTISNQEGENPKYEIKTTEGETLVELYSKLFDDAFNSDDQFAAIMTCSHADENCPYIPNATVRIPLNYEDPKAFDATAMEHEQYDERSRQIATEMKYVFSKIV